MCDPGRGRCGPGAVVRCTARPRARSEPPRPLSALPHNSQVDANPRPADVIYELDCEDRIVAVNDAWSQFALANGTPHLIATQVIGQGLWSLIDDTAVQQIYKALLSHVRAGHTIEVPFRCDSPTVKRQLRLLMRPRTPEIVEFVSRTQSEIEATYNPLWDTARRRGQQLVLVCSWCKRVRSAGGWHPPEEAASDLIGSGNEPPMVSHGICPACEWRLRTLLGSG